MDDVEHPHYRLVKILLWPLGLWPYNNSWLNYVKRLIFVATMFPFAVLLLAAYFLHSTECDQSILINTVSYLILTLAFILKHSVFWYNYNNLKMIIDLMRNNWRALDNEDEQQIVLKYADKGKFLNISFAWLMYSALFILACVLMSRPSNMDICESSANSYLTVEYITVNNGNSYFLRLLPNLFLGLGSTCILGTEITSIIFAHHMAGMFEVVCYRLRNTFREKSLNVSNRAKEEAVYEKLVKVAKIHQRTLHICNVTCGFSSSYFFLLLLGVAGLSMNFYRLSQIRIRWNELKTLMMQVSTVLATLFYLFLPNHIVQTIMNSSAKLLTEAYNTQWYTASVSERKILLFIMNHSMKSYIFNVGGLFVASYEGFSTLLRLSFSYFMVIRSTQ